MWRPGWSQTQGNLITSRLCSGINFNGFPFANASFSKLQPSFETRSTAVALHISVDPASPSRKSRPEPTFDLLHEDTFPHLEPGHVARCFEPRSLRVSGPVVWNSLPDDIKNSRTDTGTIQDWIENSPVSWGICLAALTAPMWLG